MALSGQADSTTLLAGADEARLLDVGLLESSLQTTADRDEPDSFRPGALGLIGEGLFSLGLWRTRLAGHMAARPFVLGWLR
jgi:hypothetical protein